MFDIERILAIHDDKPDHRQMGISAPYHRALVARGGITKDGEKAKESVLNKDFSKSYEKAGIIKGDKKLDPKQSKMASISVISNDGKRTTKKVKVLDRKENGLIVHKNLSDKDEYVLTHEPSGLWLTRSKDMNEIQEIANKLSSLEFKGKITSKQQLNELQDAAFKASLDVYREDQERIRKSQALDLIKEKLKPNPPTPAERRLALEKRQRKLALKEAKRQKIADQKNEKKAKKSVQESLQKTPVLERALGEVKDRDVAANLRRRLEVKIKGNRINGDDFNQAFNAVSGSEKYKDVVKKQMKTLGVQVSKTKGEVLNNYVRGIASKNLSREERFAEFRKYAIKNDITLGEILGAFKSL